MLLYNSSNDCLERINPYRTHLFENLIVMFVFCINQRIWFDARHLFIKDFGYKQFHLFKAIYSLAMLFSHHDWLAFVKFICSIHPKTCDAQSRFAFFFNLNLWHNITMDDSDVEKTSSGSFAFKRLRLVWIRRWNHQNPNRMGLRRSWNAIRISFKVCNSKSKYDDDSQCEMRRTAQWPKISLWFWFGIFLWITMQPLVHFSIQWHSQLFIISVECTFCLLA